ncbi:MAG: bifunctional DNA primase/polymerase [Hyphomicrobium sp.]
MSLLECGFAVLPAKGKEPLVKNFTKWRRPPSSTTIAQWQRAFPDSNIACHCGASSLVVVDADSPDAVDECRRIFGTTPGRVKTRRGEHALFRAPNRPMPRSVDLRALGLKADLKYGHGGQSIVIAPPSYHPDGGRYEWLGCDPKVLADIPEFDIDRLLALIPQATSSSLHCEPLRMRDDSRKQFLNDRLCARAAFCDYFDEMLDVARTLNGELADHGYPPLEDDIVVKRAQKVWADVLSGKIERWLGKGGVVRLNRRDLEMLERLDHVTAPQALLLLSHLRLEHAARCQRGETFSITPKAMARGQVILGWTRERYEKSRNLLLEAGLIERVSPMTSNSGGRIPAQYRFPPSKAAPGAAVLDYIGAKKSPLRRERRC